MSTILHHKADAIRARREHCLEQVRQGKMSVDEYLRQVAGIKGDIPPRIRAAALAQIKAA